MAPILVECNWCGRPHRWIPREVEEDIERMQARIRELEAQLDPEKRR